MTAEPGPGPLPSPGLDAQIAADFPDDPLLAALLSPFPPARPRPPRRGAVPRSGARAAGRDGHDRSPRAGRGPVAAGAGHGPGYPPAAGSSGTYRLIRAYAAT